MMGDPYELSIFIRTAVITFGAGVITFIIILDAYWLYQKKLKEDQKG